MGFGSYLHLDYWIPRSCPFQDQTNCGEDNSSESLKSDSNRVKSLTSDLKYLVSHALLREGSQFLGISLLA